MKNLSKNLQVLKENYLQLSKHLRIGLPVFVTIIITIIFFLIFSKTKTKKGFTPTINYAFGANFNSEQFLATEIYEPLTSNLPQNKLPKSVSLLNYTPNRLHQGRQGSAVGWAISYAAHTVFYAAGHQRAPNSIAFSPAFVFNQIAGPNCEGAYLKGGLEILKNIGNLPLQRFNYDEQTCQILPTPEEILEAQEFKIKGYYRLSDGSESIKPDIRAIRQHLAQGVPVIVGIRVGGTFLHQMQSQAMWIPTQRDYQKSDFFGHAMTIIGYDDEREGGAFQLVNSWGVDWGQQGVTWIRYRDFLNFAEEVYSFFPEGRSAKFAKNKLAGKIQLMDLETETPIELRADSNEVFRPQQPIWSKQQLKILVHNSIASFIYILTENEQGRSEVLFPNSSKKSAYCGITGSRMFPKNHPLRLKNEGKLQHFAVIFSKRALNWENVNNLINASRQPNFVGKIREVMAMEEVKNVDFKDGKIVEFAIDLKGRNAVIVNVEI